jgi:hypothetical protein
MMEYGDFEIMGKKSISFPLSRSCISPWFHHSRCERSEISSACAATRTKPEKRPMPEISGPDNRHGARKKFAPREDEFFL